MTLAHNLAYASDLITADSVEVTEFPYLVQKYDVMAVPRTVINDTIFVDGVVPEAKLVARLPAE